MEVVCIVCFISTDQYSVRKEENLLSSLRLPFSKSVYKRIQHIISITVTKYLQRLLTRKDLYN